MSGVLLLSVSTVLVKIMGLAFKIPMLSFLGAEGMGYFNSAYEIYALLCVISTAGLPVALSILVSSARAKGRGDEIKRVYRAAKLIFALLGTLGGLLMAFFAEPLAQMIGNDNASASIVAIAPALFPVCLASALRGYCQGFEYMTPTAISQMIEAFGKLVFGIALAAYARGRGYPAEKVAAFAVMGISVGILLSLIYLAVAKLWRRDRLALSVGGARVSGEDAAAPAVAERKDGERKRRALSELLRIAFPITVGSAVMGISRIIDMSLMMRRLQDTGMTMAQSNVIYGAYTTLALPVFALVPAIISPISLALVPRLCAFRERQDGVGENTVQNDSLRLTVILSLPASLGLVLFSRPVLDLLFTSQHEAIDISAPLLSLLGASVVFSCLITTTNAILQSYRHTSLPILSMTAGICVKLVSAYFLIGDSRVAELGAPIGTLACNICVTLINFFFLIKYTGCSLKAKELLLKPLGASVLSVGTAYAFYSLAEGFIDSANARFAIALTVALALYLALSAALGNITKNDIMLLPLGESLLRRFGSKKKKSPRGRRVK